MLRPAGLGTGVRLTRTRQMQIRDLFNSYDVVGDDDEGDVWFGGVERCLSVKTRVKQRMGVAKSVDGQAEASRWRKRRVWADKENNKSLTKTLGATVAMCQRRNSRGSLLLPNSVPNSVPNSACCLGVLASQRKHMMHANTAYQLWAHQSWWRSSTQSPEGWA